MKMIPLLILLAGCTYDGGDVTADWEFSDCTDTRDGETFTVVSSTVKNYRVGIGAATTFQIEDTDGRIRLLSSDDTWLKCVPR